MGWMVKTEFWGLKPWPALLDKSYSYSTFRKGKTKLISRGLIVFQLLQSVVTLSCLFKCHYHSISQILLCLFLRRTTKLTFRKVQSLYRGYSASKYWDRIWTQHLLQNPCSSPYIARCLYTFCSFRKLAWIHKAEDKVVGSRWRSGGQEVMRQWGKATWDGPLEGQRGWMGCSAPPQPCLWWRDIILMLLLLRTADPEGSTVSHVTM